MLSSSSFDAHAVWDTVACANYASQAWDRYRKCVRVRACVRVRLCLCLRVWVRLESPVTCACVQLVHVRTADGRTLAIGVRLPVHH